MSVVNADRMHLRDKVRGAYPSAAEQPKEKHAFPVGRQFPESLGYPAGCAVCGTSSRGNSSGLGLRRGNGTHSLPH
jgi:hypothetical protein